MKLITAKEFADKMGEALAKTIEIEILMVENELRKLTPDDLKDEQFRKDWMALLMTLERMKGMANFFRYGPDAPPQEEKPVEKQTIGFLPQREAA